jgi:hypothetical protein
MAVHFVLCDKPGGRCLIRFSKMSPRHYEALLTAGAEPPMEKSVCAYAEYRA